MDEGHQALVRLVDRAEPEASFTMTFRTLYVYGLQSLIVVVPLALLWNYFHPTVIYVTKDAVEKKEDGTEEDEPEVDAEEIDGVVLEYDHLPRQGGVPHPTVLFRVPVILVDIGV